MVEARIDLPKNYDPDMDGPIEFVRMCASGDPGAAALRLQALETCKTLRQRHSDEPAAYHLSGLVCYINDNEEAALRFWGQALHCIPNYDLARRALEEHLAADGHWSGVSAYMSQISQGENVVSDEYIELVRQHFDAGDLVQADYYAQRASAYNRPEVSKLRDIRTCREEASRLAEAGNLAACYDDVVAKFEALWAEAGEPMIDAGHTEWRTMPDRIQMADIVANVVDLVEESNPVIFELGCFVGFNLAMAAERARALEGQWIGLEPNETAVAHGNRQFSMINILQGSHDDMISGGVELPAWIDVCLISRVFMILHPDSVQGILKFLAGRAQRVVICDDIFNVGGNMAIIRMPDFILMHPFERFLSEAGFQIEKMICAEVPDRECTGFIVAKFGGNKPG